MSAAELKNAILSRPGEVIFPKNFFSLGKKSAVYTTLSNLVRSGEIMRLGKGIYIKQIHEPKIGPLFPSLETIAKAIAKKENIIIRETGAYALNKLGLSTQVPMKVVYLTNGNSRIIKVGKGTITLKKIAHKKLRAKNELVYLIIQAFEMLGPSHDQNSKEFAHLVKILQPFPPHVLRADAEFASKRVGRLINLLADQLNPAITELPVKPMSNH